MDSLLSFRTLFSITLNTFFSRYQENRGRYAVASRDIAVGEFLCVEEPAVSHMLPDYMGSNCTHCFKSMKAPLPCPRCTKVLFCSYKCR